MRYLPYLFFSQLCYTVLYYTIPLTSTTSNSQQCLCPGSSLPPSNFPALYCQQCKGATQAYSLQTLSFHQHSATHICFMVLCSSSRTDVDWQVAGPALKLGGRWFGYRVRSVLLFAIFHCDTCTNGGAAPTALPFSPWLPFLLFLAAELVFGSYLRTWLDLFQYRSWSLREGAVLWVSVPEYDVTVGLSKLHRNWRPGETPKRVLKWERRGQVNKFVLLSYKYVALAKKQRCPMWNYLDSL